MYPQFLKLSLAAGVSLALGACASFAATEPEYDRLTQIHAGLTQDEVRSVAGNPDNVTGDSRSGGGSLWIYSYTNEWGERSELDVTFNPSGVVASTYSEATH